MLKAERAPDAPPDHIPRGTTPTWEVELLLSGATVFGLLQLAGAMDPLFFPLLNRVSDGLVPGLTALWMYLKASVLTLALTFGAHLALRAYWVALVGMRSVYPGPLRWDRLRAGEIQREAVEPFVADIPGLIETADNRATRVFALGVAIALMLLLLLVIVGVGMGATVLVAALGGPDLSSLTVMYGVLVLMGPFFVASLLDRRAAHRFPPGGRARRLLTGLFRAYHHLGIGTVRNPLFALFQSGEGYVRTLAITLATVVLSTSLVAVQLLSALGMDGPGDFAGLPPAETGARAMAPPEHYASQRRPDQAMAAPFLPDRVVRGPYAELFVPYRPARHAPAMRAACGEAVAVAEQEGPPQEALACLASVLDVRLDGAPVHVPLEAAEDPLTGTRGVLLMIPAQELASGRHELTVRRIGRAGAEREPDPFRIPFWR